MKPGRPSKLREHLEQAKLDKEAVNLLCNLLHLDPHKRLLSREAYVVRPTRPCLDQSCTCLNRCGGGVGGRKRECAVLCCAVCSAP